MTDSTIAPPQNQRFSLTNSSLLLETRNDAIECMCEKHTFFMLRHPKQSFRSVYGFQHHKGMQNWRLSWHRDVLENTWKCGKPLWLVLPHPLGYNNQKTNKHHKEGGQCQKLCCFSFLLITRVRNVLEVTERCIILLARD